MRSENRINFKYKKKKKFCCLILVLMEILEIVFIYCLNKGKSNFEKERI